MGPARGRVLLVLATLLAASSCFGPLYDDVDPLAGQLGVCCNTDTSSLGEHLTVPGERATAQFFPACSCFEGPACPIHKPLGGGKCYGLTGGSGGEDAGVAFPTFDSGVAYPVDSGLQPNDAGFQPLDAGSLPPNPDAGSQSDAGAPTDAGGVDAGIGTRDAGVFTDAGVSPHGAAKLVGVLHRLEAHHLFVPRRGPVRQCRIQFVWLVDVHPPEHLPSVPLSGSTISRGWSGVQAAC